ncbi:cellulase family glycosylhydrolase [Flavobacterium piscis]|uniref:Aryl-phospho-beta-D-glucosidase BglC (GH1 family) n=1 Tax=Flavobacterium piscis TaxID=1114874 RepID=A0ABU1Y8Z9_9FLAO|nr:cellulase family glycosylhydrolase [Flavobacterium piscis]MDR7210705.1 aryl-phospho-beta-D-glucosidase BglC (GH1 family) [Flavobacterium piscis]
MKIKHFYKILLLLIVTGFSVSCSKDGDEAPQLEVSATTVSFTPEGGTSEEITIEANSAWSVSNPATSWLQLTKTSGASGTTVIKLIALKNETLKLSRSVVLTVDANNGQTRRITIKQRANFYPSYNLEPKAPDATKMSSTAVELAAKMHLGINFGNTMESQAEGDWVSSEITESYVKFVKQIGFNAVRIPCNWHWTHLSDTDKMKIDQEWLDRVHQVVKWCVENDMYVMLNIHWDGGWLDGNINAAEKDLVNAKQKALWEQIATKMRDFDEHLIFAGANEPPAENAAQMAILNSYHQTFIDAVRSTGGKNSYRVLVVQGPKTDSNLTFDLMNTLPVDPVPNKLMVEVHNYTPSTFTIVLDGDVSWGDMVYYWGTGNHSTIEPERNATYGEEDVIIDEFQKMKQKFVDKGIPVILGEYASWRRNEAGKPIPLDTEKHNQSVEYWATYVTKQAKLHGFVPFWWEVGATLDRANDVVKDQDLLDAIIAGGK